MLLARGFLQLRGEAGRECNLRRTEGEVGGGGGGNQTRPSPCSASEHSSLPPARPLPLPPARQASPPRPSRLAALGLQPGQRRTSLGSPGAGGGGPQAGLGGGLRGGGAPPPPPRIWGPSGQPPFPLPRRACFSLE